MSTLSQAAEERVLLSNVSWQRYEAMLVEETLCRGRMAYEEGRLEIMSPSPKHEILKRAIACLLEAFAQVLGIDILATGSTTLRRELKKRGAEPDESYYIQNEALVRGRVDIDLERDPPPDLVIEIDLFRSALDKLGIYAALGVPEVWCWDRGTLRVFWLGPDGRYAERDECRALPRLPLADFRRFLADWNTKSTTRLANEFRAWVRKHLG
jgi:Uma2 family endonuclease